MSEPAMTPIKAAADPSREALLALAEKISAFSPSQKGPLVFIAHERRMIEGALRLAAAPAGNAGVMAWQKRWKNDPNSEWLHVWPNHVEAVKTQGWEVRPLFASPSPIPEAPGREEIIEECAKVADNLAAYEGTVFDRADDDGALSETGRHRVQDRAIARQAAADAIARSIRALKPQDGGESGS